MDVCENNPEKLSTTKEGEYIPSYSSISPISSLKDVKEEHDAYRSEDCLKRFCECLNLFRMGESLFSLPVFLL